MSDREMYLGAMAGSYEGELPPPNTRSLKWMAKILGADIVTEPVQSAEEAYLEAIYENGGGGGVTVEALSVTENGTYTAEEGTAYSPVTVNVQGGGNPNYVETIEGNLYTPFNMADYNDIVAGILGKTITVYMHIPSAQANDEITCGSVYKNEGDDESYLSFVCQSNSKPAYTCEYATGISVEYNPPVRFIYSFTASNIRKTALTETEAKQISTVTTIIHHPLPSGS